jgi:hypothetical protein
MKKPLLRELRQLFPAWLACVLLPLPAIILWRSDNGVPWRFSCFSVGCASLVAYAFWRDIKCQPSAESSQSDQIWSRRMATVGIALFSAVVVFSLLCLTLNDPRDFVTVFKAIYVSILSICIVPYFTLVTRKPFVAVLFSIFLVFCMKLLGCVVVVLVYGWDASERGFTTTPWTHPNLLVWLFWSFTALLSVLFYFGGARKFKMLVQPGVRDCVANSPQCHSPI